MLLAVVCLLMLVSAVSFAGDGYMDGNKLLRDCTAAIADPTPSEDEFDAGLCYGFLLGLGDMSFLYFTAGDGITLKDGRHLPTRLYCLPDGATVGQGARIVVKFLQEYPEKLHEAGALLAVRTLKEAFPCSPAEK